MADVQWYRNRSEARYQGAFAFLDGKSFNRSNIITDGQTIYSYGAHFPMARKDGDVIYVNTDKYSVTTSKHQGALHVVLSIMGYAPVAPADVHERYTFTRWERA